MLALRPYQQEAKEAIFNEWDNGHKKTLLVLPTGCGKTIVFAKVTEECVKTGNRVLILAHRGELLEQAADKIASATGLGCATEKAEETCLGSWFRITVGSVQSMMREKRLNQFDHEYFNTNANILGVTATPDRGDMRNLGQYFESLAYEYTLPEAIKEGYLSPIKALTIPLKLDLTGVGIQTGDFKAGDLGLDRAGDVGQAQIAEGVLDAVCGICGCVFQVREEPGDPAYCRTCNAGD